MLILYRIHPITYKPKKNINNKSFKMLDSNKTLYMKAQKPKTRLTFAMFEPNTFPTTRPIASSLFKKRIEYKETNSYGKLVPIAITVAPIIMGDIFNF